MVSFQCRPYSIVKISIENNSSINDSIYRNEKKLQDMKFDNKCEQTNVSIKIIHSIWNCSFSDPNIPCWLSVLSFSHRKPRNTAFGNIFSVWIFFCICRYIFSVCSHSSFPFTSLHKMFSESIVMSRVVIIRF